MVASLANRVTGDDNFLVRALKPSADGSRSTGRLIVGVLLLALLVPLSLPLLAVEAVASVFGSGGDLEVYAVRDV